MRIVSRTRSVCLINLSESNPASNPGSYATRSVTPRSDLDLVYVPYASDADGAVIKAFQQQFASDEKFRTCVVH